jgi:hypothetical protein
VVKLHGVQNPKGGYGMTEQETQAESLNEDTFDFSNDSSVEEVTTTWTITDVQRAKTNSPNGKGTQLVLEFTSDDFPFPITLRRFLDYTPTDASKDTSWVNRQRGELKRIVSKALGSAAGRFEDLQGATVIATSAEDSEGKATLRRFKQVEQDN